MKLPVSKIPTFNHTFYLISYLISLSMAPIRRSNRARKPRDYWDPTNSPPHQRQPPAFIIYTEPPEDLGSELFHKDLDPGLSDKDLGSELSHKDLDSELSDKDLDSEFFNEDLDSKLSEKDLSLELDKDLSELLSR